MGYIVNSMGYIVDKYEHVPGVSVQCGSSWTSLNMSAGARGQSPVHGPHGQTNMTENMTSPTLLVSGKDNKHRSV